MERGKYLWSFEVVLYGNDLDERCVATDTEDYYEAERKVLALPGVWDVGSHYSLVRPNGVASGC